MTARGHTEWRFDDDPAVKGVVDLIDGFLSEALVVPRLVTDD